MAEDLRHRYAQALAAACKLHQIEGECAACARRLAAVMAVRDEELEDRRAELKTVEGQRDDHRKALKSVGAERDRLREENAYCLEALKGAENRRQSWRERAETAEAAIARVRRLCELTIAASCRVQAIDQARDTLAALDGESSTVEPETPAQEEK